MASVMVKQNESSQTLKQKLDALYNKLQAAAKEELI